MSSNQYIVVSGNSVRISDVLNDCVNLSCINTYKNETLASILNKLCNKINDCCGEGGGSGDVFIQEGDNISITGDGSQNNPYVINVTNVGNTGLITLDSESVDLQGDGTANTPLYALVRRDPAANNMLQITPSGLLVPNVIESGIVYGGIVTWTGDYTYHVSPAGYWIDFQFYESPAADFTLSAPDATFNRIDTFILTTDGTAEVLEGTPSSNPAQAPLDPATQLGISLALVEVGTTEPTIQSECIYRNNTEWTATSSNTGRLNPDSVTFPCNGVKALEGIGVVDNDNVLFDRGSSFFPTTITSQLTFLIRPKASFGANGLIFQWELGGAAVGDPVVLNHLSYFFDSTDTGTCQLIAIPLFHFGLTDLSEVDSLRITGEVVSGSLGFYIDDMCIQGQPLPPQAESVDNKFKIDDDDIAPGTFNEKITAGSGIVFTESTDSEGYKTLEISAVATAVLTFDNGLERTLDNTQWGGILLHDTVVDTDIYTIDFLGTHDTQPIFSVRNFGNHRGVSSQTTEGEAFYGQNSGTNPTGFFFAGGVATSVVGVSISGTGAEFQANAPGETALLTSGPIGAYLRSFDSSDNTIHTGFYFSHGIAGSGTPAQNGFGLEVTFELDANDELKYESNSITTEWLDATADPSNDLTSRFSIYGYDLGTKNQVVYWNGDGQQVLPEYGTGAFNGTDAFWLAVTATGEIIEMPAPAAGGLSSITGDNGLTATSASNLKWGGSLIENTTISQGAFNIFYTAAHGSFNLSLNNTVGGALYAEAQGVAGAFVTNGGGAAVTVFGTNNALQVDNFNATSPPILSRNLTAGGSGVVQVLEVGNTGIGPVDNDGMRIVFNGRTDNPLNFHDYAYLDIVQTDVSDGTEDARLDLYLSSNGAHLNVLNIFSTGLMANPLYGLGNFALGGETFALGVDGSGQIVEIPIGGGAGDVLQVGTPVNNQVGVWTGAGTLEGDPALTFTGGVLTIGNAGATLGQLVLAGNTGQTVTIKTLATAGNYTLTLPPNDGGAGEFLTTDGSGVLTWTAAPGGGTVTDVSVVTANGFAGSVANAATSPDITISTTVTGLMQGNGTSVSGISNSSTVGQVLRVTGASTYAWGALDLADTDAITNDLPFANLTQGSARSVLGVTGNSTADVASIQGSANQVLRVNGAGTALAFGQLDLAQAAAVTGILTVPNGGTGLSALGSPLQALRVNAGGTALEYFTISGTGTVTSVSGGTTGLTFNTPTTTPTMTGTLGVPNGGTGFTSTIQGDLFYGSAANVISKLGKNTNATRYLSNTGASNNPAWAQINLANGVTGDLPFANLTQITGPALLGNANGVLGDVAAILATADGQVMRRSGATIGFGQMNLASAAAVTGTLPTGNGGTGVATAASGNILVGNAGTWSSVAPTGSLGITAQNTAGALNYRLTVNPTRQTFVDTTGTATWNLDNGAAGNVVLTNVGRTLVISGTPVAGTTYTLEVRQDGTGNRTITTWPATIDWDGGSVPTLSTLPNKRDLFTFYYDGTRYDGKLTGRYG